MSDLDKERSNEGICGQIIKQAEDILEKLSAEYLYFRDYIQINSDVESIVDSCNWVKNTIKGSTELLLIAYGITNNKYNGVERSFTYVLSDIKDCKSSINDIHTCYKFGGKRFPVFGKLADLKKHMASLIYLLEKIDEVIIDLPNIYKAALRFDDESPYCIKESRYYTILNIEEMTAYRYRFEYFEWFNGNLPIKETDGDKYPILKQIFPEHYI